MQISLILFGTMPVNDTQTDFKQPIKRFLMFRQTLKALRIKVKQLDFLYQTIK
jgi:hypothetical protein